MGGVLRGLADRNGQNPTGRRPLFRGRVPAVVLVGVGAPGNDTSKAGAKPARAMRGQVQGRYADRTSSSSAGLFSLSRMASGRRRALEMRGRVISGMIRSQP